MEWKTVKLGDILKITGGQLYKGDLLGSGDNLLLGMGCVSFLEKFLLKGARQYGGDCLDKNIGHPGDIVLATRQQSDNLPILAMPAVIPEGLPAKKIIIGSNLYKVNVTDLDFNNRFIYWLLKTPEYVNYISSVKTGTTVKMITIKDVESYTFLCPPKESRDKISKFLWNLDDKIENNNRINRNLEAQAQALFKSWFVDFEPWGGTMPEDWREGTLGEIAHVTSGKRPPLKQSLCSADINIPLIGAADIMGYTNSVLYTTPILVTGRVGTHGIVQRFNEPCWPSDNTLVVEGKWYEYIYQTMCRIDYHNMNRGSTQPLITQTDLKNQKVIIPNVSILDKFETQVTILYKQVYINQRENQRLATLRDTLLPKLMKGEIEL